ncbi:MAG: hypothetical protein GY870_17595 [archaeon]|nr:hypothetical protein [archaeon]
MSKLTKIIFAVHFIGLIILTAILLVLLNITDINFNLNENANFISAAFSSVIASINIFLTIRMFLKNRETNTDITAYLMGFFFFAAFAGLSNSLFNELFPIIEQISYREMNGINLATQMIFLNLFINETFNSDDNKKSRKFSIFTLSCAIIWDGFIVGSLLLENSNLLMVGFGFIIILQIVLFARLSINSYQLRKRFLNMIERKDGDETENHNYERSFFYLMLVGVFLVIGFIMTTTYYTIETFDQELFSKLIVFDWISMLFYLAAYFFLYLGFTYPSRGK